MNILKTSELTTYALGVEVPEGEELGWVKIASGLADSYCRRALAYKSYTRSIRLSDMGVGYVGLNPILKFLPVKTTTGLKVKPMYRSGSGGQVSLSNFEDITIPSNIEELIDVRTGRLELDRLWSSDYGRSYLANRPSGPVSGYQAVVEVVSGLFPSTKIAVAASLGASTIQVKSTLGIVDDVTYLTIGDSVAEYLVTNISGNVLTISPNLAADAAIGSEVTEVLPDDLKVACGMIIRDLLTYQPNTVKQTEKLDVIVDTLERVDAGIIPAAARSILDENYRVK